jgi:putative oxidoreductase
MRDLARLIVRLAFGGLMAGHGAQKLFGWFGGHGLKGTAGWLESMGLRPGQRWAVLAGLSEFGGGVLTLLGLLNPVGPLATIGAMSMATVKAHWGKPIWNTSGGAELPVLNIATALALSLVGPGRVSVDNALGIRLPRRVMLVPGLALVAAGVTYGVIISSQPQQAEQEQAPAEEQPQAAQVPSEPAAHDLEQRAAWAAQEPERVAGAELQGGQEATHPL